MSVTHTVDLKALTDIRAAISSAKVATTQDLPKQLEALGEVKLSQDILQMTENGKSIFEITDHIMHCLNNKKRTDKIATALHMSGIAEAHLTPLPKDEVKPSDSKQREVSPRKRKANVAVGSPSGTPDPTRKRTLLKRWPAHHRNEIETQFERCKDMVQALMFHLQRTSNVVIAFSDLPAQFASDEHLQDAAWRAVEDNPAFGVLKTRLFTYERLSLKERLNACTLPPEWSTDFNGVGVIHDKASEDVVVKAVEDSKERLCYSIILRDGYLLSKKAKAKLDKANCRIDREGPQPSFPTRPNPTLFSIHQEISDLDISLAVKAKVKEFIDEHRPLIKSESNPHQRIEFTEMEVSGMGPFPDKQPVVYRLDQKGIHWVTAANTQSRSNGMGKSTLCVTSFIWCLTGLCDDHAGATPGRREHANALLLNHTCTYGHVKIWGRVESDGEEQAFWIDRSLTKTQSVQEKCIFHIANKTFENSSATFEIALKLFRFPTRSASSFRTLLLNTIFYSRNGKLGIAADAEGRRKAGKLLTDSSMPELFSKIHTHSKAQVAQLKTDMRPLELKTTALKAVIDHQLQICCSAAAKNKTRLQHAQTATKEAKIAADKATAESKRCVEEHEKVRLQFKRTELELESALNTLKLRKGRLESVRKLHTQSACWTCGQHITEDTAHRLIAEAGDAVSKQQTTIDELEAQIQSEKSIVAELERQRAQAVADDGAATKLYSEAKAEVKAAQDACDDVETSIADVADKKKELVELQTQIQKMKTATASWTLVMKRFEHTNNSESVYPRLYGATWAQVNQAMAKWINTFFARPVFGPNEGESKDDSATLNGPVPFTVSFDENGSKVHWTTESETTSLFPLSTSQYLRVQLAFFLAYSEAFLASKNLSCNVLVLDELFAGLDATSIALVLDGLSQHIENSAEDLSVFVPSIAPILPVGFRWSQILVLAGNGKLKCI